MAEPGRCATCTWWEGGAARPPHDGWGRCAAVEAQTTDSWATLVPALWTDVPGAEVYELTPMVQTPWFLTADLWTAPTFGCIRWEARDGAG